MRPRGPCAPRGVWQGGTRRRRSQARGDLTTQWSRPRQWQLCGRRVSSRARRLTAGVRLRAAGVGWQARAGGRQGPSTAGVRVVSHHPSGVSVVSCRHRAPWHGGRVGVHRSPARAHALARLCRAVAPCAACPAPWACGEHGTRTGVSRVGAARSLTPRPQLGWPGAAAQACRSRRGPVWGRSHRLRLASAGEAPRRRPPLPPSRRRRRSRAAGPRPVRRGGAGRSVGGRGREPGAHRGCPARVRRG